MTSDNAEAQEHLNAEALRELSAAYKRGHLLLFVGAGVSSAAGLPGWRKLAERLLQRAQLLEMASSDVAALQSRITKERYPEVFSALKRHLGEVPFFKFIENELKYDSDKPIPAVAESIARLAPGVRNILTTNLDNILERALKGEWPAIARLQGDSAQKEKNILKIHGTLEDHSTWVFTKEDYERIIYKEINHKAVFDSIFRGFPVLFIGYGLVDDDLEALLGEIRAVSNFQGPHHFAILPAEGLDRLRRQQLQNSGLTILTYDSADGKHEGLSRLLMQIPSGDVAPTISPLRISSGDVASVGSPSPLGSSQQAPTNEIHSAVSFRVAVEQTTPEGSGNVPVTLRGDTFTVPAQEPTSVSVEGSRDPSAKKPASGHRNISGASAGGATTLLVVLAVIVFLNKNNPTSSTIAPSGAQPKAASVAPQRTSPIVSTNPAVPSSAGQKETVSAVVRPATLRELRKRNHTVALAQIQPGATAADLLNGTYGFIGLNDVSLLPHAPLQPERSGLLEIHRLSSGELQIVGWVLPDFARGMDVGGEVAIAVSPVPTVQSRILVSIPLGRVRVAKAIRWQQGPAVKLDLAGVKIQ